MAFGKKDKDPKAAAKAAAAKQETSPTPPGPSAEEQAKSETPTPKGKVKREVVSLHPSEMKAVVLVGGKKHKVVYHLKKGVGLISLPNLGSSVPLQDWLDGKVDIKGLEG